MINSVRNTVLSVANKNNYGYITPSDFNLYAKQAQLEIFESYFNNYNDVVNRENARRSGTEYGDTRKGIEEAIDIFSVENFLSHESNNSFYMPSLTTTGDDYYLINKVLIFSKRLTQGSTTSVISGELVDAGASFLNLGISIGDIVTNTTTKKTATVLEVTSATVLVLSSDIFTATSQGYAIYDRDDISEAERVSNSRITSLNMSLLTKPSTMFPAYSQKGNSIQVYPEVLNTQGQVFCQYIRYPKDPKWTYVQLLGGEPSFDQTQLDYQDFELPLEDEFRLIEKILQYAGISIRESEVYQFAKTKEVQATQSQQTQ